MKISSFTLIAATLVGVSAMAPSLHAIAVTFDFITTSGPSPGGGTFTAEAVFDSSLFGAPAQNLLPSAFTASLTGNSSVPNHTWTLNEVSFSQLVISAGGVLTFSGLQATDTAGGAGAFLNGGSTGFSAPVTIGGNWQQRAAAIPDNGPGFVAAVVLGVLGVFAHRARRKNQLDA